MGGQITFNPSAPSRAGTTTTIHNLYLTAVACPSASQCTAVSALGQEVTFAPAATGVPTPTTVDTATPSSVSSPVISGTAKVGQTLSASTGTWTPSEPAVPVYKISYGYRWQLCAPRCSNIAGATASSLTLTAADAGKRVRVLVTASNAYGSGLAASSEVGAVAGLTSGQVRAAVLKVLGPSGQGARIGQLLRHGSYSFWFTSPSPGRLVITWYLVPKGAHITKANTPVLVANLSVVLHKAGRANIKIVLTAKGRKLLKGVKHLKLTAKGTFTPTGQATTSTTKSFTVRR